MSETSQLHTIKLYNGEDEDVPTVLAVVEAPDVATWAKDEMGSIEGSHWESDGNDFAYACFLNTPGLLDRLRSEGYKFDASDFTEAT